MPLLDSNKKYGRRAVAVTLVSSVEQYCRMVVARMLASGRMEMPAYVEIPPADLGQASGLPAEAVVSFTYNFANTDAILRMLCGCGLGPVARDNPLLLGDMCPLYAARNDLVHTSVPVAFDMRKSYDAVMRFFLGVARHIPGLEVGIRLLEGDIFRNMRRPALSRGGYEEAARLCGALASADPGSPEAHAKMGLALAGLDRHDDALASFSRSLSIDKGQAYVHLGMAQSLEKTGRRKEALASCDRAMRIDPSLVRAHLFRAITLANAGQHVEAIAACDEAIELDGELPRSHLLRGEALAGMGRLDEALASFDKAIGLDGYDEVARVQRAVLLSGMVRRREALAECDAAIEIDPQYAEAHLNRADILDALGEYDEALCSYNRAVGLDPRLARAHAGKGRVLGRLGRGAEAARCYKEAHDLGAARR